jgi:hypothetical protein
MLPYVAPFPRAISAPIFNQATEKEHQPDANSQQTNRSRVAPNPIAREGTAPGRPASIGTEPASPEQTEARRARALQFQGDSEKVRRVAMMIASALDPNPRRLKQFINLFRLQAYIANELGFFDADQPAGRRVTFEQLDKFVAISLKWPALLAD